MNTVELGVGLIGIGREWGKINNTVPTQEESLSFLKKAFEYGIRFFDTAPAYGLSEERLGLFLRSLNKKERDNILVATKFGEHWNDNLQTTYIDHSFEMLKKSFDSSLSKLGKIDILQLHKSDPDVLLGDDFRLAIAYVDSLGIKQIGASISDEVSGKIACDIDAITYIQLPYNLNNNKLLSVIHLANSRNKKVIINRPFDTGSVIVNATKDGLGATMARCFEYVLRNDFIGYVLTGTKSVDHLKENINAFKMVSLSTRKN